MKVTTALRVDSGCRIAPFGDPVSQMRVLEGSLEEAQDAALAEVGLQRGPAPAEGPYLVYSDRTWFTAELLRKVLAGPPGRLQVQDPAWWETTGPLQETEGPGLYELALHPGGDADWRSLPPVTCDLGLRDFEVPSSHPILAEIKRPVRIGAALVHQVDHWSHVLRVNQLGIAGIWEAQRLTFEAASWPVRVARVLPLLLKARSADPFVVMAAASRIGKNVKIHPTAVVEVCRIGDNTEIGAYSVLRNSIVGPGVRVEEHCTVTNSVVGPEAHISKYGFVNFCVLWPRAFVSTGGGWQFSLFGEGCFVAWGATGLDLNFRGHVPVWQHDQKVDSGIPLLGVAIGHRAVVANAVRINYGMHVPNGAFLVASAEALLRDWADAPVDQGPLVVQRGRPVPVKARSSG